MTENRTRDPSLLSSAVASWLVIVEDSRSIAGCCLWCQHLCELFFTELFCFGQRNGRDTSATISAWASDSWTQATNSGFGVICPDLTGAFGAVHAWCVESSSHTLWTWMKHQENARIIVGQKTASMHIWCQNHHPGQQTNCKTKHNIMKELKDHTTTCMAKQTTQCVNSEWRNLPTQMKDCIEQPMVKFVPSEKLVPKHVSMCSRWWGHCSPALKKRRQCLSAYFTKFVSHMSASNATVLAADAFSSGVVLTTYEAVDWDSTLKKRVQRLFACQCAQNIAIPPKHKIDAMTWTIKVTNCCFWTQWLSQRCGRRRTLTVTKIKFAEPKMSLDVKMSKRLLTGMTLLIDIHAAMSCLINKLFNTPFNKLSTMTICVQAFGPKSRS